MIFYLLIIIISSCPALEPLDYDEFFEPFEPFDYGRLIATEEYKKLEKATQAKKDEAFRNASEYYLSGSRENMAIALFAGGNPNLNDGCSFSDSVFANDITLVKLFFDKGFSPCEEKGWGSCRTPVMASLLMRYGLEIYDPAKNINAVDRAIIRKRTIKYIEYLLTSCRQSSKGSWQKRPLLSACYKLNDLNVRENESLNKNEFKTLVDFGANPYLGLSYEQSLNPLEWLDQRGQANFGKWLQQYYHVRNDLMPLVLTIRFMFLKINFRDNGKALPDEIVDKIVQLAFYGGHTVPALSYLKPEVWEWHGKVPKAYENYRNKNIRYQNLRTWKNKK